MTVKLTPNPSFSLMIRVSLPNQPGMLAKIAAGIADADSNIDSVSVEESDGSAYTNLYFTVQVKNRVHLAELMRGLRKIPDVVRINRTKGNVAVNGKTGGSKANSQ